jgi:hypothetical protein
VHVFNNKTKREPDRRNEEMVYRSLPPN